MKTVITFLVTLAISITACADRHQIIKYDMLPIQAQTFIQKYFSSDDVIHIERERDGFHYEYNVYLTNAVEIDFDGQGNLESIDCGMSAVPKGIVPEKIMLCIEYYYSNCWIVEYSIDYRKRSIELNNSLELEFDIEGNLLEIDN